MGVKGKRTLSQEGKLFFYKSIFQSRKIHEIMLLLKEAKKYPRNLKFVQINFMCSGKNEINC